MFNNLRIKNKTFSDRILGEIRSFFEKSGYSYKSPEQVKIISGQEEGIFAWIASNHLGNKFEQVKL